VTSIAAVSRQFRAVFLEAAGTLVQPTPQNKPGSSVTIKSFEASQV
jgi:hypothetical protein